jgi:probable F420-dependent oxidoreductase
LSKHRKYHADIPGHGSADEIAAWAKEVEPLGLDCVWSSELYTSPFVSPAAVAVSTKLLNVGTSLALAFVRSPMETALSALDLDRLSNGRFRLGLGTGVQRLNESWHNVTNYGKPVKHLRETVEAIRLIAAQAFNGDPIHYDGEYYKLDIKGFKIPYHQPRREFPIYLGAIGEVMARLSGEVADGLKGHSIWSDRWVREKIDPNVHRGLKRANRMRDGFDLVPAVTVAISSDIRQARRDVSKMIAFYATVKTYLPVFTFHGFERQALEIQETFRRHGHGPEIWSVVTDEMVEAFCPVGDVDRVRKKLEDWWECADGLTLRAPHYYMEPEETAEYQRRINETFYA